MADPTPHTRAAGPTAPHPFVDARDARSALSVGSVQANLQMGPAIAVTAASLRPVRCALAGCGKPREDLIHAPAE